MIPDVVLFIFIFLDPMHGWDIKELQGSSRRHVLKESERVFLVIVSIEDIGAKVGFWIAECFAIVSASLTASHCQQVFFPIKTRLLKISPNIHATVC